jgi:hypothetical protein
MRGGIVNGIAGRAAAALLVALAAVGGAARAAVAAPGVVPVDASSAISGAAAACAPELNSFDRTRLCVLVSGSVQVLQGSTQVGAITFGVTHFMQLSARSRDFTERITISQVRVSGSASGVHLSLRASCAGTCSATVSFPQGEVIADGLSGTVNYHDGVAAGRAQETRSLYTLEFTKPGDRADSFSYRLPIGYRCDDELPGVPAGCVLPAYLPYIRTLKGLPGVAYPVRCTAGGRPVGRACAAQEAARDSGIAGFYTANRVLAGDPFWVLG